MTDQAEIIASYLPNYFWVFDPRIDMDCSARSNESTIQIERQKHISSLLSIVEDMKNDGHVWSVTDAPLKWQTEGIKLPSTSSTSTAGNFNFMPYKSEYIQIYKQKNCSEDMTEDLNDLFDAWLYTKNEPNGGYAWIHKDPTPRLDYIIATADDIVKRLDPMRVDLDSMGLDQKLLWSTIRSD